MRRPSVMYTGTTSPPMLRALSTPQCTRHLPSRTRSRLNVCLGQLPVYALPSVSRCRPRTLRLRPSLAKRTACLDHWARLPHDPSILTKLLTYPVRAFGYNQFARRLVRRSLRLPISALMIRRRSRSRGMTCGVEKGCRPTSRHVHLPSTALGLTNVNRFVKMLGPFGSLPPAKTGPLRPPALAVDWLHQ
jgi:hypothetical protein